MLRPVKIFQLCWKDIDLMHVSYACTLIRLWKNHIWNKNKIVWMLTDVSIFLCISLISIQRSLYITMERKHRRKKHSVTNQNLYTSSNPSDILFWFSLTPNVFVISAVQCMYLFEAKNCFEMNIREKTFSFIVEVHKLISNKCLMWTV